MNRRQLTQKLERIIGDIETKVDLPLSVKEIYVFGSYARNEPEPADLDLILVYEKLTEQQEKIQHEFIFGYGTSLEQKMNGRIKASAENIDILYGPSLEMATSHAAGTAGFTFMVWSKEDRGWREKLSKLEKMSPESRAAILETENDNLRESIHHLRENILAFQLARNVLDVESRNAFEKERYAMIDKVRKERKVGRQGLELL